MEQTVYTKMFSGVYKLVSATRNVKNSFEFGEIILRNMDIFDMMCNLDHVYGNMSSKILSNLFGIERRVLKKEESVIPTAAAAAASLVNTF